MRAVVIYESMYGNTRVVAESIAAGLRATGADTDLVRVVRVEPAQLRGVDLVVAGAPTHAWGISRTRTRQAAADAAAKPDSGLSLEPDATGPGMREWLRSLPSTVRNVAVFDTRMSAPCGMSGSASRHIARAVRRVGGDVVAREHFMVTRTNQLVDGELGRARQWGERLGASFASKAA